MPRRHRPPRGTWGRNATLELVLTAIVLVAVIAVAIVFLFVYHDLPFRVSGP